MQSLLNIQNARAFRGTNIVLDNFSLNIGVDQNTAIIGPNGAGKSTLLKLLARELYPQQGSVEIFGQARWNVWELRQRLGLVSDDLQKNYAPGAEGFSVILSGYYSSSDIFGHQAFSDQQIEVANQTAKELGIEHLRDKLYSTMSTGEQRRHLLARALVNQPEALVLDEPTTGLDLPAQFAYVDTIRRLMQKGNTLVLVTHHIHEIPPEVSNVVLMKAGKVLCQGEKSDVLTDSLLSELFETKVKVVSANGFFQVLPD